MVAEATAFVASRAVTAPPSSRLHAMEELAWLRATTNIYDFARYLAPPTYQFSWHHDVLYRWLNDVAEGRRKRVIIEMPPGHGKALSLDTPIPTPSGWSTMGNLQVGD